MNLKNCHEIHRLLINSMNFVFSKAFSSHFSEMPRVFNYVDKRTFGFTGIFHENLWKVLTQKFKFVFFFTLFALHLENNKYLSTQNKATVVRSPYRTDSNSLPRFSSHFIGFFRISSSSHSNENGHIVPFTLIFSFNCSRLAFLTKYSIDLLLLYNIWLAICACVAFGLFNSDGFYIFAFIKFGRWELNICHAFVLRLRIFRILCICLLLYLPNIYCCDWRISRRLYNALLIFFSPMIKAKEWNFLRYSIYFACQRLGVTLVIFSFNQTTNSTPPATIQNVAQLLTTSFELTLVQATNTEILWQQNVQM